MFSPEEFPADELYDDLAHMIIGKPADRSLSNHMDLDEYKYALDRLRDRVYFIYPESEGFGVENVLGKMEYLVDKYRVSAFLLDPYNQFDHEETTLRDDLYIGKFMSIFGFVDVTSCNHQHLFFQFSKDEGSKKLSDKIDKFREMVFNHFFGKSRVST